MTSDFEAIQRARRHSEHIADVLNKSEQISREFDPWRAAGVNPPTPRRSITMPATSPAKAILAAVAAFLASFLATVQGRTDLASMKAIDWIIVLLSAAVTGLGVYLVPNKPTGTRRSEAGQSVVYIIGVVALVVVVVWVLTALIR